MSKNVRNLVVNQMYAIGDEISAIEQTIEQCENKIKTNKITLSDLILKQKEYETYLLNNSGVVNE